MAAGAPPAEPARGPRPGATAIWRGEAVPRPAERHGLLAP